MIWLWSNTSRSQFIKLITLCLYRWGAGINHDKGKFTLRNFFPQLKWTVEIEVNSRNWNLCSRGKYFLCNLFLLWSNLPASFNSNDRVFIYLEKVFGKKVVATHTWIQDGWEQGGLYCQRSCLLALLLTLEVAEKACKVWEKNKNKKKATLCHHFHSSGRALMLCPAQPLFSATFLSIMHIILNILHSWGVIYCAILNYI